MSPARAYNRSVGASQPRDAWAERTARALAEAGYKRGGARRSILELLDGQACALSAVEIEQALRDRGREVSRASVYRVLDVLTTLSLLLSVVVAAWAIRSSASLTRKVSLVRRTRSKCSV